MSKHSSEDDQGDQGDRRSQGSSQPRATAPAAGPGLYRASDEHDACGVGFIAHIKGRRSHAIVRDALTLLVNLEHRGASGSDPDTGDGAGILVQMPDRFLRRVAGLSLPPAGAYGAGLVFLPHDAEAQVQLRALVARIAAEEGQVVIGWRAVPTKLAAIGRNAAANAPAFEQVFIARAEAPDDPDAGARAAPGPAPRRRRRVSGCGPSAATATR
jgi:glutamate synthase domain-containing protein 1